MNKKNFKKRSRAFEIYLEGGTYQEIADEIGVSTKTIQNWSSVDDWVKRKEEAQEKISEDIFERLKKRLEKISSTTLSGAETIAEISKKELGKLEKVFDVGFENFDDEKAGLNRLKYFSKLLIDVSTIQKNISPTITVVEPKGSNQSFESVLKKALESSNDG